MILRRAIASLALCLTVAGVADAQLPGKPIQPSPASPPIGFLPMTPRPMGVLIGEVVDAATGRGVARAVVRLNGRGVNAARMTDERGRFYFTNLPDADVAVTASKPGFFDGAFGQHRAGGDGIPLTMSNGRWITDLRLEIFKAAAISGIVADDGNEPLVGVRVRAWRREFSEGRAQLVPAGEVTTDNDGLYRLFNLPPGEYVISVPALQVTLPLAMLERAADAPAELSALLNLTRSDAGTDRVVDPAGKFAVLTGRTATPPLPNPVTGERLGYQTEFYPGFERSADAFPVAVGPGEDRNGVHFQLRLVPTHRVAGIVTGPNGPLPRQLVRLVPADDDDQGLGSEAATTITDAEGKFTLLNVPSGDYVAQVRALGTVVSAATPAMDIDGLHAIAETQAHVWGDAPVSLADKDVSDLIIVTRPTVGLRGRLVLESLTERRAVALNGMTITLLPESRSAGRAITLPIDPSGVFAFANLAPGSYYLRAGTPPHGWSLKSVTSGGSDGPTSDALDHPINIDENTDVVVTLTDRPTEIDGTVHDQRGVVVAGATILALPPVSAGAGALHSNRLRSVRAATSGVYALTGLPPGEYVIVAIEDEAAADWQDPRRLDALRALGTKVTLAEGEKQQLNLRLTRK